MQLWRGWLVISCGPLPWQQLIYKHIVGLGPCTSMYRWETITSICIRTHYCMTPLHGPASVPCATSPSPLHTTCAFPLGMALLHPIRANGSVYIDKMSSNSASRYTLPILFHILWTLRYHFISLHSLTIPITHQSFCKLTTRTHAHTHKCRERERDIHTHTHTHKPLK